jgi:hypothetical protein
MRGTLVIARCYGGRPAVLRVWDRGSKLIYLSEESQFQQLSTGREALPPIGFPADDVFAYDPAAMEQVVSGSVDWGSLRKFSALSRYDEDAKNNQFVSSE